MGCQYFAPTEQGADSFTVAMPRLTVGRGTLSEVGERTAALGVKSVALFTDPYLIDSRQYPVCGVLGHSCRT